MIAAADWGTIATITIIVLIVVVFGVVVITTDTDWFD